MGCFRCGGLEYVRNGFAHGCQRYKCKGCGCNFTKEHARGYPMKDKVLSVILHLSGMSMNSIAPIIGVSTQTIMRWIRSFADDIEMPSMPDHPVEVEMDEMHHFLLKKLRNSGSGRCWITSLALSSGGFLVVVIPKPGNG